VKELRVNAANCSGSELVAIAKQSGFEVFEGAKHTKIKKQTGEFVTMIPRHENLNKHTVKGVVEAMNAAGAKIVLR
jgi:hypothetical protein